MRYDLGYFVLEQRTLQAIDNSFGTKLSLMSSGQTGRYVSRSDKAKLDRLEMARTESVSYAFLPRRTAE